MRLSSQIEYAMLVLTHLARSGVTEVQSVEELGKAQEIPKAYLEKILLTLKHGGLVESKLGQHGGFRLARSASEISLADVVRLFDQPIASTRSVSKYFYRRTPIERDAGLKRFFQSIRDYTSMRMESTSLSDIIARKPTPTGIYFDHGATTYPKPEQVLTKMEVFARDQGGSGGRSGHSKSIEAFRHIDDARTAIAKLLGARGPECVCFTLNATEALNTAIYGLAEPGCRIVTTSMEHNSVWRPLVDLRDRLGCSVEVVRANAAGIVDARDLSQAITPETTFVVMTCASNVTGAIQPIDAAAERCQKLGIPLILDAAQAAGGIALDLNRFPNAALCFTGHKGLLGPQGTGGIAIDPELAARMRPLKRGGTGTRSESHVQPEGLPEKFESGTTNGHGLAGLGAGARHLLEVGVEAIRAHEMRLWQRFREGLRSIPSVRVYGPTRAEECTAITSLTVQGIEPTDVGFLLEVRAGVMTRTGLHCAPMAHETIGTMPLGTVRFSFGLTNTEAEVDAALAALAGLQA